MSYLIFHQIYIKLPTRLTTILVGFISYSQHHGYSVLKAQWTELDPQYTSSEHVFPLQQLHYSRLGGRHNNYASVFPATNKPSMSWYVDTRSHFKRFIAVGNHT